ncbi:MAG: hypothetical protein P4L54_06520 [Acidocella sp.]|nr:hypothetical protein [Acidocella sp.]
MINNKVVLAGLLTLGSAGVAAAQPDQAPAPGTLVVHLNGQFQFQIGLTNPLVTTGSTGTKTGSLTDFGFFRLYPGFDATTKNGLQYGVASEIRDTSAAANGAGVNSNSTSTNGTVNLYVRRAYAYVGTSEYGYIRFGQTDGAFGLLQDGVIGDFGDGQQWNSDGGLASYIPGGSPAHFIYADTGKLYTTSKIVYLSPSFDNFNFAVSYEPNSNGLNEGASDTSAETSIPGSNADRRINTFDGMIQYTGHFDGVGIKTSGGELIGSPLGNTTTTVYRKQLEVTQFGTTVDIGALTLGANIKYGQTNHDYEVLQPGQRKGLDYIVGATYRIHHLVFGGSIFEDWAAASHSATTHTVGQTYSSIGAALGATYEVNKNLAVFISYLYGQEHDHGSASVGPEGNSHQNAIGIGSALKW